MKLFENVKHQEIILLVSALYGIIMGSGLLGFGTDYHTSYYKSNYSISEWYRDALGWRISTFEIFNYHLGVYLTSFILAFSTGKLTFIFFRLNHISSIFLFSSIFLIIIFTWPIFQSTSNAMRQGLAMSFFNLSLCALVEKKNKQSILFILLSFFSHTTGPFLLFIYSLSRLFNFLNIKNKFLFFWVISLLIFTIIYFYLTHQQNEKNIIIGYDFSLLFLFVNLTMIFLLSLKIKHITNNIFYIVTFLNSFFSPVFFFHNLMWQYERINMIFIIINIFVFGMLFKKKQNIFLWFIAFLILLYLTYETGMYGTFKKKI